nr:hypothetical protein [Tanacetum cinerariifolium]
LILTKWKPNLIVSKDDVTKVLLWVKVHKALENQLLSVSLLICLGKHDCVERIPSGQTRVCMRVMYEWKPPMCYDCHVFGYTTDLCPRKPKPIIEKGSDTDMQHDGFMVVTSKKKKAKAKEQNARTEMAFEGNTQLGEGVADFKRRRQDFHGDSVMDLTMASGRSRLTAALEDSTWRRHHDYIMKPS